MYSEDLGASWTTVVENIHPPGFSGYTDSIHYYFNWYVYSIHLLWYLHVIYFFV